MDLLISSFTRIVPVTAVVLGLGWSAIMVWTLRASSRERRRFAEAAAAHEQLPRTFRSISPPALSPTSRGALRDVRERGIVARSDAENDAKAKRMLEFLCHMFSLETQPLQHDGKNVLLFVHRVGKDGFSICLDTSNDLFAGDTTHVTSAVHVALIQAAIELLIDFGRLYDAYCRGPTARSAVPPETWQKAVSAEFVDRATFVRKVIAAATTATVGAPASAPGSPSPAIATASQAPPPESEVRQRATTTTPAIPPTGAD